MRFITYFTSVFLLFLFTFQLGETMQCFLCKNQYENIDKCQNTIQYCSEEQDRCLSEISWKLPSTWVPEPIRHYGLSKSCATNSQCESLKYKTRSNCTHNKYEDWNCVECCEGNLCNLNLTMKGSALKSNLLLLIGCSMLTVLLHSLDFMLQTIKE